MNRKANKEAIVVKTAVTIDYYRSVADRVKDSAEIRFATEIESAKSSEGGEIFAFSVITDIHTVVFNS